MDRESRKLPYSADIEWYLTQSDAALGIRSSLGSFIAKLERLGSLANLTQDPYTDQQLGWGETWRKGLPGTFEKHRRLYRLWLQIPSEHQRVLAAHYLASMLTRYRQKDSEPKQEPESRLTLHNKLPPRAKKVEHRYIWAKWPIGVESKLGRHAGVALMLANDEGRLEAVLKACEKGADKELDPLLKRAETAIVAAHRVVSRLEQVAADHWYKGAGNA